MGNPTSLFATNWRAGKCAIWPSGKFPVWLGISQFRWEFPTSSQVEVKAVARLAQLGSEVWKVRRIGEMERRVNELVFRKESAPKLGPRAPERRGQRGVSFFILVFMLSSFLIPQSLIAVYSCYA